MGKSFVRGAFILMLAASVNRVIGFIYQAIIYRLIGPEGMGLYNLVYPIYILIIVVTTAGIPLGISKLVSESEVGGNRRRSYQILWLSLLILICSGIFFTLLSYSIAPLLKQHVFVNQKVYPIFLCLLPGVIIVSISSAFRGFFQGLMNMNPPAVGQVAEQVVRVFAGFTMATLLLPRGLQWAVVGISLASIVGELIGLLVMLFIFFRSKPVNFRMELPHYRDCIDILRQLIDMCTPITLGRIAATIMLTADSLLIPVMLKKVGYTTSMATALYGQLTSVALTLLFIPSVITVSLATSLVPAISEAVAQNRPYVVSSRTSTAVRVTIIAGIPFIAAYLVLSNQLTAVIYGSPDSGVFLRTLAIGGLFAYLQQTTSGVLQGLGLPAIPLKNMLIGGMLKIAAISTLAFIPGLGFIGIIQSYNLYFILTAVLNIISLYKFTAFRLVFLNDTIKPFFAGICTALLFTKVYTLIFNAVGSASAAVALSITTGFPAYLLLVILLGTLKSSELKKIPVFNKFF